MSELCTIIGGRGYIGSALASFLRRRGCQVQVPGRDSPRLFDRDLGQVYYCAGYTGDFATDPSATIEAHAGLLSRLLKDGEFKHLIYLSSTRVYDQLEGGPIEEDAVFPVDPSEPRHLYDLSKLLGEWLCLNQAPDRSSVARLSCVYSDDLEVPAFLPLLVRRLTTYGVACIPSWPHAARDYVHMNDVCQALVAMAEQRIRGIYNVASGENVSNLALSRRILETTGLEVTMSPPDAAPPPPPPQISVQRLRTHLGITPLSVMETLPDIIARHAQRHAPQEMRGAA